MPGAKANLQINFITDVVPARAAQTKSSLEYEYENYKVHT